MYSIHSLHSGECSSANPEQLNFVTHNNESSSWLGTCSHLSVENVFNSRDFGRRVIRESPAVSIDWDNSLKASWFCSI